MQYKSTVIFTGRECICRKVVGKVRGKREIRVLFWPYYLLSMSLLKIVEAAGSFLTAAETFKHVQLSAH